MHEQNVQVQVDQQTHQHTEYHQHQYQRFGPPMTPKRTRSRTPNRPRSITTHTAPAASAAPQAPPSSEALGSQDTRATLPQAHDEQASTAQSEVKFMAFRSKFIVIRPNEAFIVLFEFGFWGWAEVFFYQNPLAIDKLIFRLEQAFPILNHWLLEVVAGRTTQNVFQGWAGCGRRVCPEPTSSTSC